MGKTTRTKKLNLLMNRLENIAAAVIFKYDAFSEKVEKKAIKARDKFTSKCGYIGHKIENGAARIIEFYDIQSSKFDRLMLILHYRIEKIIYSTRKKLASKKKSMLSHFAGGILIALGVVALFSYATGYSYSYNGRQLGYVKSQEDVLKILNLVSDELSREYGTNIQIDKDKDIKFDRVYILDKDIDNVNTVLKRLSYMSDMQTDGYAIIVDGKTYAICESKKDAKSVLSNIKYRFVDKSRKEEYKKIEFKEDVQIKKVNVKLAKITSNEKAIENIISGGREEKVYEVKPGDTFSEIFAKFDTELDEIKRLNPDLDINSLMPGDKIKISSAVSAVTVLTEEKTSFSEALEYKVIEKTDSSMYKGDSVVEQEGVDGKKRVTAMIIRENGEILKRKDLKTEILQNPVDKIVINGTKPVPKTAPTGSFIHPVPSALLTSEFGWRWGRLHSGIDLAAPVGTPIRASDGGTVVRAGWYGGYGLCIDIQHRGGVITRYGHCNDIYVSVGSGVYQGQVIAEVGNTGNSTGAHCHFEININGSPVNPYDYL